MKVTGDWKAKKGEEARRRRTEGHPERGPDSLKSGRAMSCAGRDFAIKDGETSPPKRYNSGSMILAMENAGQLIEDEELRAQIKGSGIGTSATRAEILKKLVTIQYLSLAKKTQVITPTLTGELVFDAVDCSIRPLLNPELTASWEKGLTRWRRDHITEPEYMEKLTGYIRRRTEAVLGSDSSPAIRESCDRINSFYKKGK